MNETSQFSVGVVTAYGAAVRGGYQGTYAEFCEDMADLGDNVAEVRTKAAEAAQSAQDAEDAAQTIQDKAAQIDANTAAIDDLNYKPITIGTFTVTPTVAEIGDTVTAVTLAYVLNKIPVELKLDGANVTPLAISGSISKTGQSITAAKTYTLTAKDAGSSGNPPTTATKTATINFWNSIYWGAAALQTITSAFLRGLSGHTISSTKGRTINVNAGAGQYIWYALPSRLGAVTFEIGGFTGGFEPAQTVTVENAHGYSESYLVYHSTNPNLGSTEVVVK